MPSAEQQSSSVDGISSNNHTKRKKDLFGRLFSPKAKRARTDDSVCSGNTLAHLSSATPRKNMPKKNVDSAQLANGSVKGGKPGAEKSKQSLEKARRDDVKGRLNAEAINEKWPLAVGTLSMMASALSNQALPKLLGKLLDEKSASVNMTCRLDQTCSATDSVSASKALVAVVIGGGFASFLRTTMLSRAQDNIAKRLRAKLFSAVLTDRDMEWFVSGSVAKIENGREGPKSEEKVSSVNSKSVESAPVSTSPGAIGSILTEDINKASESVTTTFANILRSCSSCAFATYHMISLNPTLFGISVCVVPVVGAAAVAMNKFVKKSTEKQRERAQKAAAFAEERIAHIQTVKFANREKDEVATYVQLQEECSQLGRKVSSAKGTFMGFMFAASGGALYLVFNAGGRAVADGQMTSGDLTSFVTYSFLLGLGTSGIFKALGEFTQGLVSADRVYDLMDGPTNEKANSQQCARASFLNAESVQSISVDNISFSYKSSPERLVLQDVSLKIERGKVIAIVGKNGSGKTTCSSVIAGLYPPQGGKITLEPCGLNFNTLDRQSQTLLIQVVPQHPALFDTTIKANVAYFSPNCSDDDIEAALAIANCNDFIGKLPGGLNFRVGRNGMRLSGGQRQRLALARALLSDPFCLILDEPTSALDAEGETAVTHAVDACRGLHGGRSMGLLLITHRASTLKAADLIVVFQDGKIVEQGSFSDLCKNKESALCEVMSDLS